MMLITVVGNVGKTKRATSPQGKEYFQFSVAVNEGFGDNVKTTWWTCISNNLIPPYEKFVKVGNKVLVTGTYKKEGLIIFNHVDVILWAKKKDDEKVEDTNEFGAEEKVSTPVEATDQEIPF